MWQFYCEDDVMSMSFIKVQNMLLILCICHWLQLTQKCSYSLLCFIGKVIEKVKVIVPIVQKYCLFEKGFKHTKVCVCLLFLYFNGKKNQGN